MTDVDVIKQIASYNEQQLLDFVMENPEYLTDPYYRDFRKALYDRYGELDRGLTTS